MTGLDPDDFPEWTEEPGTFLLKSSRGWWTEDGRWSQDRREAKVFKLASLARFHAKIAKKRTCFQGSVKLIDVETGVAVRLRT